MKVGNLEVVPDNTPEVVLSPAERQMLNYGYTPQAPTLPPAEGDNKDTERAPENEPPKQQDSNNNFDEVLNEEKFFSLDKEKQQETIKKIAEEYKNLRGRLDDVKAKIAREGGSQTSDNEVEAIKNELKRYKEFVDDVTSDFTGAWKKHGKELKLPGFNYVKNQLERGDIPSRLAQWQETTLKKHIEKKFNLVEGEFNFDANEAEKADTPSAEYRRLSQEKEKAFKEEYDKMRQADAVALETAQKEQLEDLKWIAQTYFQGDETKARTMVSAMDAIVEGIQNGKVSPDKHPFRLRNMVRGIYYDDLVKEEVTRAVTDLKKQYEALGFHLPSNDLPVSPDAKPSAPRPTLTESEYKYSPAARSIANFLK